jgi:hypothetical protein
MNRASASQDEFCPPLDTTLVAALLADSYDPTESYIGPLRDNLRLLCSNAKKRLDIPLSTPGNPLSADAPEASSHSDAYAASSATSCTSSFHSQMEGDQSSMTSDTSFSSPFGFLTSLFPNVPPKVIETTLASAGWVKVSPEGDAELNMDAVMDTLLSEEFINEIVERGYVPGEAGDPELDGNSDRRLERSWEPVQKTKKAASSGNVDTNGLGPRKGKRIKPITTTKAVKVSLFDVPQRQHVSPVRPLLASALPPPDPWVHFASLATQLHHLVSSTPYARFLALFHDPTYATPAVALRAHLVQISARSSPNISQDDIDTLAELVPILNEDELRVRTDVMRDAAMCLGATSGRKEDAYDLMVLLRDLDVDSAVITHSTPQPIGNKINSNASGLSSASTPVSSPMPSLPSVSAPMAPSTFPRTPIAPLLSAPTSPQRPVAKANPLNTNATAWQTVNHRVNRAIASKSKPSEGIAAYITACQDNAAGGKVSRLPSFAETNINGDANGPSSTNMALRGEDVETCRERADEYRVKRDTVCFTFLLHLVSGPPSTDLCILFHFHLGARHYVKLLHIGRGVN